MLSAEQLEARLRAAKKFVSGGCATNPDGAAFLLAVSGRTLSTWRKDGKGPPFLKLSRVLYPLDDLAEFINSLRQPASGSNAEKRNAKSTLVQGARGD